jgi:hypothetical protein
MLLSLHSSGREVVVDAKTRGDRRKAISIEHAARELLSPA